jgi:hypothetical protein
VPRGASRAASLVHAPPGSEQPSPRTDSLPRPTPLAGLPRAASDAGVAALGMGSARGVGAPRSASCAAALPGPVLACAPAHADAAGSAGPELDNGAELALAAALEEARGRLDAAHDAARAALRVLVAADGNGTAEAGPREARLGALGLEEALDEVLRLSEALAADWRAQAGAAAAAREQLAQAQVSARARGELLRATAAGQPEPQQPGGRASRPGSTARQQDAAGGGGGAAAAERDALARQLEALVGQLEALTADKEALVARGEQLLADRTALVQQVGRRSVRGSGHPGGVRPDWHSGPCIHFSVHNPSPPQVAAVSAERDSLATQNTSLAKAFASGITSAPAGANAAGLAAGGSGGLGGASAAQMREIAGLMQRLTKENAVLIKARCGEDGWGLST